MEELQNMKWSTWEELLLSCAVHRYGDDSWDSVAAELQKRSSTTFHHHDFTAEACQRKFHDLKRQFNDRIIVDELKKLRVAELKRDVERYDLSIVSLQLKVKRLKEEEESSSVEPDIFDHKNNVTIGDVVDEKSLPANAAGNVVGDEISDRDSGSRNESSSTVLKQEDQPAESLGSKPESADELEKPAEESCNGSSDSVAAKGSEKSEAVIRVLEGSGRRENSDVQSQAEWRSEIDDQSPAIKSEPVETQSLAELLEILRSHKLGSIIQIQHDCEETTRYKSMIRQHMDLETIQSRLEKGCYSNHSSKFFRYLLLLSNNALVFYGTKSAESMAAIEFRQLISSKLDSAIYQHLKLDSSAQPLIPATPLDQQIKPDPEPSALAVDNEKKESSLIACGNRSSAAVKTSVASSAKKIEKPDMDVKEEEKLPVYTDKVLRERRHTPKNTMTRVNSTSTVKNQQPKPNEKSEAKPDNNSSVVSKKRSASNSASKTNEHARRDQAPSRRGYNGKQVQAQGGPARKSGGRPVKRAAAPLPPVLGKRSRESGGGEAVASSSARPGKKRSQR